MLCDMKKVLKKIIKILLIAIAAVAAVTLALDIIVVASASGRILREDWTDAQGADCILVLGCGLRSGKPSPMLADRLDRAIELYEQGVSGKILVSGDHGQADYDEVNVMKNYCVENGVPSEDVFMDHAGFSTYDSMYRAQTVFRVERCVVVTQQYHLYRAVYIGQSLGIETWGVPARQVRYSGQLYRDLREVIARDKDLIKTLFRPASQFGGEAIPVSGNGNVTNDK